MPHGATSRATQQKMAEFNERYKAGPSRADADRPDRRGHDGPADAGMELATNMVAALDRGLDRFAVRADVGFGRRWLAVLADGRLRLVLAQRLVRHLVPLPARLHPRRVLLRRARMERRRPGDRGDRAPDASGGNRVQLKDR